jgi:hypothetical protein
MRDQGGVLLVVLAVMAGAFLLPTSVPKGPPTVVPPTQTASERSSTATPASHPSSAMTAMLSDFLVLDHTPAAAPPGARSRHNDESASAEPSTVSHLSRLGRIAEARGFALDTMVATVPDPVDSYAKWMFDRQLDAILRAVAATGYQLDRYGPADWWHGENSSAHAEPVGAGASTGEGPTLVPRTRDHTSEPGVILFRASGGGRKRGLLVLLLVPESATQGIYGRALLSALDSAAALAPYARDVEEKWLIRLLAPTFSGTITSLRLALQAWFDTPTGRAFDVRIVSGSADNAINQRLLQRLNDRGHRITFHATVPPNIVLVDAMRRYLEALSGGHRLSDRLALLVESNTSYGAAVGERWACPVGDTAGKDERCHNRSSVLTMPFPLHISRLRAASSGERRAKATRLVTERELIPLNLGDSSTVTDALPAMTPNLTFASLELALGQLLGTLQRERVRYVGLMGTDTRDKLFLAEQISRRAPNVTLFTFGSDLLFLHSAVNSFVRGMLVASAYPLNGMTQRHLTSSAADPLLVFHHSSSQGVYNAAVALLAYDRNRFPRDPSRPVPLVDYTARPANDPTQPRAERYRPSVWISVVGRDGLVPVDVIDPATFENSLTTTSGVNASTVAQQYLNYVFMPREAPTGLQPEARSEAPAAIRTAPPARITFVALTLVSLGHALVFLSGRLGGARRHRWAASIARWPTASAFRAQPMASILGLPGGADPETTRCRHVAQSQLLCLVALLAASAVAWSILRLDATGGWWSLAAGALTLLALGTASALSLADVIAGYVRSATDALVSVRVAERRPGLRSWVVGLWPVGHVVLRHLPVVVLLGYLLFELGAFLTGLAGSSDSPGRILRFYRMVSLTNGVTPLVPLTLICSIVYCWGAIHLRMLTQPTPVLARLVCGLQVEGSQPPLAFVARLLSWRPNLGEAFDRHTTTPLMGVHAGWYLLLLGAGWLAYNGVFEPFPVSVDGPSFGRAVTAASLLLHLLLGLTLVQFYSLWRTLRAFLRALTKPSLLRAFEGLGRDFQALSGGTLAPRFPRLSDLEVTNGFLPDLALVARLGQSNGDRTHAQALRQVLRECPDKVLEMELQASAKVHWSESQTWRVQRNAAMPTVEIIQCFWATGVEPPPMVLRATQFVAALVTIAVREIQARLAILRAFLMTSVFLMLGIYTLYPFDRAQALLSLAWAYGLITIGLVLTVFVQMDRDPVLGRLKGHRNPGHFSWDREMVGKLALNGGVPIATLLAAQFPDVFRLLFEWVRLGSPAMP